MVAPYGQMWYYEGDNYGFGVLFCSVWRTAVFLRQYSRQKIFRSRHPGTGHIPRK